MKARGYVSSAAVLFLLAVQPALGQEASVAPSGIAPTLDLTTLEAAAPQGTYRAEQVAPAYVGEAGDGLFLAVVYEPEVAGPQEIRGYVCDGAEISQWLTGRIDASGSGQLLPSGWVPEEDPDVRVEFETNGELAGTVRIGDENRAFTLVEAAGQAGLYRAEESFGETEHVAGWIVLADGRQVGGDCVVRCFRNPITGERMCHCFRLN